MKRIQVLVAVGRLGYTDCGLYKISDRFYFSIDKIQNKISAFLRFFHGRKMS